MLKIIALFISLILPVTVKANITPQEFSYKFCNHHKFKLFLIKIYDSYLCFDKKEYLHPEKIFKTDFSLILNYDVNIKKNKLIESSIKEINRYYSLNQKHQNDYQKQLNSIFSDIKKGDVVEAKYNKNGVVSFYHNQSFAGKITESDFSQKFLDIWLYKDNKYKSMTKDLFRRNE